MEHLFGHLQANQRSKCVVKFHITLINIYKTVITLATYYFHLASTGNLIKWPVSVYIHTASRLLFRHWSEPTRLCILTSDP